MESIEKIGDNLKIDSVDSIEEVHCPVAVFHAVE